MPIKVYQSNIPNPGLEYDENMVCEDFLNMGTLPLEIWTSAKLFVRPSNVRPVAALYQRLCFFERFVLRAILGYIEI